MRYQLIKERKSMKFKSLYKRERKALSFDIKEKIKKAGKEYCVYDAIQEARADTEIYPTLEKYGCIDRLGIDTQKVYADITAFGDLRSMHDQQIAAAKMWEELPWDVRKEFNNNIHTFLKEGKNWIEKKIAEQTPKEPVQPVEQPTETTDKGE